MTRRPPTVRPYAPHDREHVLKIWLEASSLAHPFFSPDQLREQQALVRDVYLEKAETWVADADETVAGFLGLLDSWIGGLFVAPSCQGQGIGRALVDHAMSLKQELALEVYESNSGAIAFYERSGFAVVGRREVDDNELPFPLLKMIRRAASDFG